MATKKQRGQSQQKQSRQANKSNSGTARSGHQAHDSDLPDWESSAAHEKVKKNTGRSFRGA